VSRRIVLTSFGWRESGGGTLVPRLLAGELVRRGWDVTVFYAGVGKVVGGPYQMVESDEDGVRLVGVFNRPHGLLDLGNPAREVDDPPITHAFASLLDRVRPDVVHFHNLHNLGASLVEEAASRGIRSLFSAHNHWLICPRAYLMRADGALCAGPGDRGADCATCAGSGDRLGYRTRLEEIRARMSRSVSVLLAPTEAVKRALVSGGYPAEMIDVLPQALPGSDAVWRELGEQRAPGRPDGPLRVGFFGSVLPHKGAHVLVEAAQRAAGDVRVEIYGELPAGYGAALRGLDRRGIVTLHGDYSHADLPRLLAGVDVAVVPSVVYETQVLVIGECLAGRVPVVASRLGGIPDSITDGETGFLFDAGDAADLAAKLDRLAQDRELHAAMQRRIGPPCSFASWVDQLEAYYAGSRPAAGRPERQPLALRWIGDHARATSLSIINQRVGDELERDRGIVLQRFERDGSSPDAPLPHLAQVEVRHHWPPDLRPAPAGRLALIQPWEFGAIPADWVAPLRANVDELWVPSEYVRRMYLAAGLEADRVRVVPNGVDLERFRPDGPRMEIDAPSGLRLLFVGGMIGRKGPDLLLAAYERAFAGRDDVTLVVKDFGADSVYAGDRSALREWSESGRLPCLVYLHGELSTEELASLYRACDVLVHPYRGEGFAMPVLEAMACGLPPIVTAGGPTDEFCPPDAAWRIRAQRRDLPEERVDTLRTAGRPWMLEPDADHLAELMLAAADESERRRRSRAARPAAERLSWQAVGASYRERIGLLAARPPLAAQPAPGAPDLPGSASTRVLATPAWRGADELGALLASWAAAVAPGDDACLYLLADPRLEGDPARLESHVVDAAARAGVDLERSGDVTVLVQPLHGDDAVRLHRAFDAYVALHDACDGHSRLAAAAGSARLPAQGDELGTWLAARAAARRAA
jgi:glycosyltransferase involved in cell wall biosynthesis